MSSIVKSEAVVLRAMNYRESSKIVKFYTREYGIVSGIVKGARRAKSKFSGPCLEPMSYVSIVFFRKESREIQTVSECALMKDFRKMSTSLEKMAAGMSVIELVSMASREGDENRKLFSLLVRTLDAIDETGHDPASILCYFEMHLASVLGFGMTVERCSICGKPAASDNTVVFSISRGGIVCSSCGNVPGESFGLDGQHLEFLTGLSGAAHPSEIPPRMPGDPVVASCSGILWSYLRHHIPGMHPLRSQKVFSKILPVS